MIYHTDSFPGREVTIDGQKYLFFGGTSYLGLQTDAGFQELFIKNIKKYGTNYGASRKSNLRISVFQEAESALASVVGSQACTTLSSGYLAGQLVAQTFKKERLRSFYAPNSHSALYQQVPEHYENLADLNQAIQGLLASQTETVPVLFLDSIDFSESAYPDFEGLKALPLEKIILVVDDSHGIGIMGHNGGGAYRKLETLHPKELLVCGSLGKGLGIQAGAIFGTRDRILQLTETDFFGGASPAAPAALATFIDSKHLYSEKRILLEENLQLFLQLVRHPECLESVPHHPALSFENPKLADYLERNGAIITNFKYPKDDSTIKSRIVISACHTQEDIQQLAELLNSYQ